MPSLTPRRLRRQSLLRRYVVIFVGLVGASLVVSGVVQAFFTYRDNRDAILSVQQESARAASANISQIVTQAEVQVGGPLPRMAPPPVDLGDQGRGHQQYHHLQHRSA